MAPLKYLYSTDHKVIGLLYGFTSLCFLLVGFVLVIVIRWQLAFPGQPVPYVAGLLGAANAPGGIVLPEFYNQLGAMHGTIMVFLGVVPLAVGAFGNYLVPLQIGAPDMAFPRLNLASYWFYAAGGAIMLASFFLPGGAANNGWTSYAPLSDLAPGHGQTFWLLGMLFIIFSSLLGALNFITTIVQLRAPGLTWFRLPFFVWAQFVTAFLLLLAFPALQAAALLQGMDRLAGSSFFLPSGLAVSGQALDVAGGGNALLWQHLFWFLGHPEVYVLILPAMGIAAEVIANNTRKPLWGYRVMVYSVFVLGFLSFVVWAHHMFLTGMGTAISAFFQTTTMIISIPSVVILSSLILSLYGGSIRFTTPMLFALAFLPMFGIGGLTGLPLGLATTDIPLHDTNYVVGHFHYLVAPGTIFALFAGIYHWFPRITGRMMNDVLGRIHFAGSLICMNVIFLPMFVQGLAGVNRRLWDGGAEYAHAQGVLHFNVPMSIAAFGLAFFQLFFIVNLFMSIRYGRRVDTNPWEATTLEWNTGTAPVRVYRDPYDYSVPGAKADFTPQYERAEA
ncbi:MAG: cytochrome C oxidase subunit I [Acidobacteria bacterium RIFCSPLOWO2_12_FULL_67_14]|nr:MAG: cytochrome C oxidase subunit I [Acidobacteria bacterium RIFCSPLOWO2_02_FULL_67_21]OFW34731.1 MAG: cytochrome C oxidase subunit I [Acidobacteria bacterium RIFCSPLOWO2_12_FULL_67_14]